MDITTSVIWLFLLALPVASISWTVTHEEIFREPREFCAKCSKSAAPVLKRKFFYVFTCEYCFSHYVTLVMITIMNYKLLLTDWRGYVISFFALVWVANLYMNLFLLGRTFLKKTQLDNELKEQQLVNNKPQ